MPYQVRIEKFQGPLEVLLQLIEEQKLPISEISLAEVTQQFLEHIKSLQDINPELLADFLTVASKLLVIKSKTLLPSLVEELEEEEEFSDLAYQLTQFKKFKLVAKYLESLETKKHYSFAREGWEEDFVSFYPDPTASIGVLYKAMQSLAHSLEEITRLPKQMVKEVISISQKIKDLQNLLGQKIEIKLSEALQKKSRTEIIVTFLALLELIKQRILTVDQEMLFSEIKIRKFNQPVI
ncbi:MAG: segregation/condensation protein A [Patescibacteria group bacterium]